MGPGIECKQADNGEVTQQVLKIDVEKSQPTNSTTHAVTHRRQHEDQSISSRN